MVWWQRSARQDQTPWNGYLVWWVVVVTFLPSCRHARRMLDSVMWLASANGSIADAALQKLKKCLCIWTLPLLLLFGTLRLPWEEAWFRGWDAIWGRDQQSWLRFHRTNQDGSHQKCEQGHFTSADWPGDFKAQPSWPNRAVPPVWSTEYQKNHLLVCLISTMYLI